LIVAGTFFVFLAFIGVFLPVMPTIPFLVVAAWFYDKSCPKFHYWLFNNRLFGSYLKNYVQKKGMSIKGKILYLFSLWLGICFSVLFLVKNFYMRIILILMAVGFTIYIVRIKTLRYNE